MKMKVKKTKNKIILIFGLTMGLPGTIIGLGILLKYLDDRKLIDIWVSGLITLAVITTFLVLVIRNGLSKK